MKIAIIVDWLVENSENCRLVTVKIVVIADWLGEESARFVDWGFVKIGH